MGITDNVWKILKIKIKPRQDSYFDQFSRIFMLKVMLVGALFTGMNWYGDTINCLTSSGPSAKFVSSACWINGFYIFEEIRYHDNAIGYYGLPRDISFDGRHKNGELCATSRPERSGWVEDPTCTPMKKTYFLQYQYMTFFLVLLGSLYYVPYSFFKLVNTDMVSLKKSIKGGAAEEIVASFFNRRLNSSKAVRYRAMGNCFSRILYVIMNILAFVLMDMALYGTFTSYGPHWVQWSQLNNTMAYDYMGFRLSPKPGDAILPSFAFCEVHEAAEDIKHKLVNQHRMLCELSQHILYQYILILLWFAMVVGIVVSIVGLVKLFVDFLLTNTTVKGKAAKISHLLNTREFQYLDYIHQKNLTLFGEVLTLLQIERTNSQPEESIPLQNILKED